MSGERILTRAARRKAGLPPPTPLFKAAPKLAKPDSRARIVVKQLECDSSSDDEDVKILWVQCDYKSCQKWRKLASNSDVDLSRQWYCHMHPDPNVRSCETPEEKWRVSKKRAFTFSRLTPGQLVWAKMKGYPPWPAIVSPDPWSSGGCEYICEEREGCIYHVEFLGKPRTHIWIPEEQVEPYQQGVKCSLGAIKKSKRLEMVLQEAEIFLPLTNEERLKKCEYQKSTVLPCSQQSAVTTHTGNQSAALQQASVMSSISRPPKKKKCEQPALNDTTNLSTLSSKHSRPPCYMGPSAVEQKPGSMSPLMDKILSPQMDLFKSLGIDITEGNLLNLAKLLLQNLHQSQPALRHCGNANLLRASESGLTVPTGMTAPTQCYPLQLTDPSINFQLATTTSYQQQPLLNSSIPTNSSITSKPKSMGNSMIATGYKYVASSTELTPRLGELWRSASKEQLLLRPISKPLATSTQTIAEGYGNQTKTIYPGSKRLELSENSSSPVQITCPVANLGSVKGQLTPLRSQAKLMQASLDAVGTRTVQFNEGKRRKPVSSAAVTPTSKRKGKQREVRYQRRKSNCKQNTPASLAAHHTIPQYFATSSPVKLLDDTSAISHTEVERDSLPTEYEASDSVTLTKNQLVPESCLEVEAHCEMKEIEEMLLLFGSDTPSVSPAMDSHNKRRTLNEQNPELDFDSMLNEMSHIEGLIQDLSKAQLVPY